MTTPKLAVAASGYGGRGYRAIFEPGTPTVPSITTALGAIDHPGLRRWERQQVAAFAVAHAEDLLNRDEEVAYRYLMAVPKFLTPEKADDIPYGVDVWNAAEYALDYAANTGTWIHSYIEDDLRGHFNPDPIRDDHYQMVEAYFEWKAQHDIEVLSLERTVFGDGYAGTGDLFAIIDGVVTLVDWKSSKAVRDSHIAQLAAIGAAHTTAVEVPEGTAGAVEHKLQPKIAAEHGGQEKAWFVEEPLPDFQQYAVVQVRPMDYTDSGEVLDPFCEMHVIPQGQIDAAYDLFRAGLSVRMAQRGLKEAQKEAE